jgi:polar amino acid transport system permease protein
MDFWSITLQLFEGFGTTCLLFALTLVFSLPLGLVVSFGSMSKWTPFRFMARGNPQSRFVLWLANFRPIAAFVKTFVWIIRGTPLMLQLFVVFYVPGMLFHVVLFSCEKGRFTAALVAFVINYACYFSEIYRGGIESIPRGQYEAAQVLSMTKRETFFTVILMQVVKRILAPMSNEVITLVKDTSLARSIAVAEIFFVNEMDFLSRGLIWPLFYIAVFFLVFVGGLTILFNHLEKKLSYYRV